ncbi:antichymotrypsin-2-like isoform X2 [Thrips palmi]|uniref:Antichymotrypsin-2-like isoform X2 n=1 Tax=Thrips palmi TaxID=161013 RepID=A0A6P8YB27_THRPL|nr:antichymotrypsin-2-like isoform X2 [Thrips palmi]
MTRSVRSASSLPRTLGSTSRTTLGLLIFLVPFIATMASSEPLAAVVKGVNDFTLDFYLTTAEKNGPGKNVLVSPLSAALVTAMVHAGAKGVTANEITKGLRFPEDKATLEDGFRALHGVLANTPNVTLEIANRIYLDKTTKMKPDYTKTVTEVHKSDVESADFMHNHESERQTINNWVLKKTHDKIKDLLSPGMVTPATSMVLVNAVYFFGKWKEPFDREQTYDQDFFVSKSKTVKVPMMHLTKTLRYAEIPQLKAKAVELCYANKDVCLQIILPDAKDGLEKMQKQLREGAFDLSNIEFYPTKVQLSMPKFKLEETINIKDVYQKMGMKAMFQPGDADFSGISEEKLVVSEAIQKTFMDVNEEGTEAAAATACVARRKRCVEEPLEIFVDHPFLFRLVHSNSLIFIGSHFEPTVPSEDCAPVEDDVEEQVDSHLNDNPQSDDDRIHHKRSHCEML